jgi:hypothetical protein
MKRFFNRARQVAPWVWSDNLLAYLAALTRSPLHTDVSITYTFCWLASDHGSMDCSI